MKAIDADRLSFLLQENFSGSDGAGIIQIFIDDKQTLEVAPVVHAHWVDACIKGEYFCSNCCQTAPYSRERNEYYKTAYCPTCGAEMDEETAQEENRK